jgi:hypothetical protein
VQPLFDLTAPLPAFEPGQLTLFNKGTHDVPQAIPGLERWLDRVKTEGGAAAELINDLELQVEELKSEYALFRHTITTNAAAARHSRGQTSEMFEMSRRYCVFHAAAAAILLWVESRHALGDFFARGEWLTLALRRLLHSLRPAWDITPARNLDRVSSELTQRFFERTLFSVAPMALAGRRPGTAADKSAESD